MIPLKDNVPTSRFAILTAILIVINVGVFAWQFNLSGDRGSSTSPPVEGLSESDEAIIEYGAIPYRITHPGKGCGVAGAGDSGGGRSGIVCEGTARYSDAAAAGDVTDLDAPPWWVTVLTSMFMHGGILHLVGNMLFLWVFGNNVEDSMGRLRFIAFYLLAGIAAVYAQALLDTGSTAPTIGASGAVSGVLGAYMLLHPRARVLTLIFIIFFVTFVEIPAVIMLGIWFVLQFLPVVGQVALPDVVGDGGIAYLAHVGGFVFGLIAIKLFANRRQEAGSGLSPAH